MGFRSVLENCPAKLTDSDRRIGFTLLSMQEEVPVFTAAQLAVRADVHESTVIRFAQKLGYAGFPALKEDLVADLDERRQSREVRVRLKSEAYQLDSVVDAQINALRIVRQTVRQETLDAAAKALLGAERVILLGYGLMRPLVDFMERRLTRKGLRVLAIRYDGSEMIETLMALEETDGLLIFALEEQFQSIAQLVPELADRPATVLMTDDAGLMLRRLPTHLLAVPGRDRPAVVGLFMVLSYALGGSIAHQLSTAPGGRGSARRSRPDN
ncbi:MurR/RpiR family transcriptional regulator [Rhodococcoides kyotonense]|uniref:DNA-binding transcriptional regulator, MurR/RpiR family, contains HTH and SIS domains n=1 Tax=Rhodococcoides kyotonense TaxID=398843 RepID=A0A239N1Z1_9NOCA|nr:MurR/RpiR family transcriptional regulator [Rhodococcus kyotonensis]SNT48188.1 DNA-binding transcriptional regulator, MurR/RpiR family, contains HTH and SIS domains [Rhodococcus kyotonensis]